MMKDYLSVNEFSKLSGIEKTTLRYWDEIGLFSPAKRDPENNYRYYAPEQIIAVNFITVLSELHIPLKTIGAMESGRTPESIIRLIEQQAKQLDMEMSKLRERYSIIHARLELIKYGIRVLDGYTAVGGVRLDAGIDAAGGTTVDVDSVAVLHRDDLTYILGPPNGFQGNEDFYEPFMRFCRQSEELRVNLSYPIGGYHTDMKSFCKTPGQPDHFISIDPTGNRKRPAGNFLIGFARGYYGTFGDLPDRMAAYAEQQALRFSGPVYTLYLHDEICIKDPSQYLVQICVAVS
ncbi:MAG: MerR family transcriptional regulator [Oscillospiraceae bacterium]|nr:MerR family transcriptional regulator [Oscillospiraceae bacterium]